MAKRDIKSMNDNLKPHPQEKGKTNKQQLKRDYAA